MKHTKIFAVMMILLTFVFVTACGNLSSQETDMDTSSEISSKEGLYFQGMGENLKSEEFAFEAQKYKENMIIAAPQLEDWEETSADQTIALTRYLLERYNIDDDQVYANGYSGGGETMSIVLEKAPELFTAYLHCSSKWDGAFSPVAEDIQQVTGGDLFSIETSVDYPGNIDDLIDYASKEQEENVRPELTSHTIQELEPDATVISDGFAVTHETAEGSVSEVADDVETWLHGLGY